MELSLSLMFLFLDVVMSVPFTSGDSSIITPTHHHHAHHHYDHHHSHHHHNDPYSDRCQSREEETMFLGSSANQLQDKLVPKATRRNVTHTELKNLNDAVSSRRYSCPWKYELVTDTDRYPSVMLEAKCLHRKCEAFQTDTTGVASSNSSTTPTKRHGYLHTRCREVFYFRWVKVKDQVQGQWVWKLYPVPVGCTCARLQKNRVSRKGSRRSLQRSRPRTSGDVKSKTQNNNNHNKSAYPSKRS